MGASPPRLLIGGGLLRFAAILGLLAVVLAGRLPGSSKLVAVLNNAAHAPAFALVALLVHASLRHLSGRRRLAASLLTTIFLGLLVEIFQGMTGRDASWLDVWTDALGAVGALALARYLRVADREPGRRPAAPLVLFIVTSLAILYPVGEAITAYAFRVADSPQLLSFDRPLSLYFVETRGVQVERRRLPSEWDTRDDEDVLQVVVVRGQHPGINLTEPLPNWRERSLLKLDVTNPGPDGLPLTVRVHDRAHDNRLSDRFNRTVEVAASTRTVVSIPLADVEAGPSNRRLDLGEVAGMIVFTSGKGARPGRRRRTFNSLII